MCWLSLISSVVLHMQLLPGPVCKAAPGCGAQGCSSLACYSSPATGPRLMPYHAHYLSADVLCIHCSNWPRVARKLCWWHYINVWVGASYTAAAMCGNGLCNVNNCSAVITVEHLKITRLLIMHCVVLTLQTRQQHCSARGGRGVRRHAWATAITWLLHASLHEIR